MTNKTTKRALLSSVLALLICVTMLIGTTFAWFTDNVTSKGNIIKSGKLDVGMYWAEGDEDPATFTDWKDASKGAIFSEALWEPGYTEAKHLKIVNEGNLALKYQLQILANGIVSELANVIDVYYLPEAKQLTRENLATATKLGVLSDVINNGLDNALINNVAGELEKGETDVVTLALKMQESAGNEYQNLSIGTDFTVKLIATQLTSEEDSFGKNYDRNAEFPAQDFPLATVLKLTGDELNVYEGFTNQPLQLDVGYQFLPTESYDIVEESSPYKNWHADFVVSADKDVKGGSMMLAGYYQMYDAYLNPDREGDWVGITTDEDITAGTELRLVKELLPNLTYSMVCNFGNDGIGFLCGAKDIDGSNEGTTLTVRLRIFEVGEDGQETEKYMDVGIFEYTFGGNYVTAENGAVYFYAEDGDVVLYNARGVEAATFEIPEGVTEIDASAFEGQTTTKTVVFPSTVKSIGKNAFKNSVVESVTLNEGLTEIGEFAFNGATKLADFNIPSTVTTIGTRAFRLTAKTELVIPANVTKIVESFRDMSNLTTVTIEGNAEISNFAFRSCANLESVYLLGDDVTFTGTGQAFSREDSGKSAGITIYVKNATVASRLYAAQASANSYADHYAIKILGEAQDGSDAQELVNVKTEAALKEAIADNKYIALAEGTYSTNLKVAGGSDVVIEGNGTDKTVLNGQIATTSSTEGTIVLRNLTVNVSDAIADSTGISQTSKSAIAIWGNQTVICENVTFNMSLSDSSAITSWWDTGIGTSIIVRNCTFNCNGQRPIRATGNVTVENCTFNDPYRYAVQLTAKASTATELDKAIINFKNNTIVNGENGKAYVYGIQLEGADYGCNDCVINGSGNTIVNGGTESTMYYCECGIVEHETIEWNVEVDPVHEG